MSVPETTAVCRRFTRLKAVIKHLGTVVQQVQMGHEVVMDSPQELREKAERYRRLARTVNDSQALIALNELAERYETFAAELEAAAQSASSDTSDA